MKFITPLLAVITLFISSIAHADLFAYPMKKVRTLIVCSLGTDCKRNLQIFELSANYIKEAVNVELDVVGVLDIRHEMTGTPETIMDKWMFATEDARKAYNVGATIVFRAPYSVSVDGIDFEAETVAGLASGIGNLGNGNSMCWVKVIGNDTIASRITTHELGHLMGAWHTNGEGIMAPSVSFNQYADAYAIQSLEQIREYVSHLQ